MNACTPLKQAERRCKAHDSDQNRWEYSLAAGGWRPVSARPAVSETAASMSNAAKLGRSVMPCFLSVASPVREAQFDFRRDPARNMRSNPSRGSSVLRGKPAARQRAANSARPRTRSAGWAFPAGWKLGSTPRWSRRAPPRNQAPPRPTRFAGFGSSVRPSTPE